MIILSGLLISIPLAYPTFFFLSWFALIPIIYVFKERTPLEGLLQGWLLGIVIFLSSAYWLYFPLLNFSGFPWFIALILFIILVVIAGSAYGVWGLFYCYFQNNRKQFSPFWLAFSWTGIEYLRFRVITPLPFAFLGYTQERFFQLLQLAEIGGIFLLSFLIALINGYLYKLLNRRKLSYLVPILIIFIFIFTYGNLLQGRINYSEGPTVGLVQTGINPEEKWKIANIEPNLKQLISNSKKLQDADLIIWPESALTFDLIRNEFYREEFNRGIKGLNTYLQVGSLAIIDDEREIYNSSFLITPDGKINQRYNKIKLVPFGEYLPLAGVIKFLTGYGMNSEMPGEEAVLFKTSAGAWRTAICSEILHPELIQRKISGADFIVNQSNEAWYPGGVLQQQMWTAATFRAVENRRAVIRVGNKALGGIISPTGETIIKGKGLLKGGVTLNRQETLYQRQGDLIGIISLGLTVLFILIKFGLGIIRSRR